MQKFKHYKTIVLCLLLVVFLPIGYVEAMHNNVLSDKQTDWLENNIAEIKFAPEKDYPPMIWEQYGDIFGVSKDYFDYIQQIIGYRFDQIESQNLSDILNSAKNNKEKLIISSLAVTPQRSEYLIFTRPYFSSPTILVSTKSKKMTPNEIIDKGLTVAVGNHYGVHDYIIERYPDMKLLPLSNNYQVLQALLNDKADLAVIDIVSMAYLMKENNISGLYKIGDIGFSYDFSFAVPKDMPILRNILDDAISAIPNSFQKSILDKWEIDHYGISNLVANPDIDLLEKNSIETKTVIILMVSVILLILFGEFLMHRFIFRERLKHEQKI